MMWPPNTKIVCVDDSPVAGIKDGKLSLTKGNIYISEEYTFELNGTIRTLADVWVAVTGDNGIGIICRSSRFQPVGV